MGSWSGMNPGRRMILLGLALAIFGAVILGLTLADIGGDASLSGLVGIIGGLFLVLRGVLQIYGEEDALRATDTYIENGIKDAEAGEYQRAIENFDEALEVNPRDAEVHYYRALAHAELGQSSEALADLEEARQLTTDDDLSSDIQSLADRLER